jgi:hypothetical protein
MPSLLVVIFVVELVVQLINTIGAATINSLVRLSLLPPPPLSMRNLPPKARHGNTDTDTPPSPQIWRLYLALPTPLAGQFADQRKKQKEYLAVRHELNATSSQDEFAKWAKLRRQHDKLLDELEKKSRHTHPPPRPPIARRKSLVCIY